MNETARLDASTPHDSVFVVGMQLSNTPHFVLIERINLAAHDLNFVLLILIQLIFSFQPSCSLFTLIKYWSDLRGLVSPTHA